MEKKLVKCVDCDYFRMWEDDPCCLEPDTWKLVIPDMYKECDKFKELSGKNSIKWAPVWEEQKKEFFERYKLKGMLYDEYISQHPEMKNIVEKDETSNI